MAGTPSRRIRELFRLSSRPEARRIAGVLLGFLVPVAPGLAEQFDHRWRPLSAGVAVPVFAFFAAGVSVTAAAPGDPITVGIAAGLLFGKCAGVLGTTWLVRRVTRASLGASWWDVFGLSLLAGIGFTVSLLIAELAFGSRTARNDDARIGILAGTLICALLATVVLRIRNRHYRRLCEAEERDDDADGVPDVYQEER
jgi:NhaA family Na+:H+ antiporter